MSHSQPLLRQLPIRLCVAEAAHATAVPPGGHCSYVSVNRELLAMVNLSAWHSHAHGPRNLLPFPFNKQQQTQR